ncbi:hypothetical protein [Desulforamulus aeronauticus]|uniref:Uncharacterized protein n=1 Tax=Desulforamulus aeronauticus DSM 10349 TaxID=1121421 RepID=A0A1M6WLS8_9FIRM|nr:hypothetical protein [Desulforamulus aeronauticus]SHK94641.1 hypothetical protein SAMN02745123_03682 [Desulforamulus aeronauticus DSM 10349]
MGKKITFSEGAELLRVPISIISKWFSQGLFKDVELDRKGPGGPTYLLKLEELLAIRDSLEAEKKGIELANQEIAASQEKKEKIGETQPKKRLSLVKSDMRTKVKDSLDPNPGKDIVLRIQEDTAAGLANTLIQYLNNFEQKFLQHMEEQADRNALKYNTMAIEHLETLKNMSTKMEKVVDALVVMPQKVTDDTVKIVSEIKEMLPDMNKLSDLNKGTDDKLEAVNKKLERLTEEIKDTKWAVVKMARDNTKVSKKMKNKGKLGFGFSSIGKILGIGK